MKDNTALKNTALASEIVEIVPADVNKGIKDKTTKIRKSIKILNNLSENSNDDVNSIIKTSDQLLPQLDYDRSKNYDVVEEAEVVRFGVISKRDRSVTSINEFQSIEEAKSKAVELQRFVDEVLVEGVDYGIIRGFNKPSLLKSGAEKICSYYKVVPMALVVNRVEDYHRPFFSYESKIELIDNSNGMVKATGFGLCNSMENRYAMSNPYEIQNTLLKMAKKRSLVDAVLNLTGLSASFTQDLEDIDVSGQSSYSKYQYMKPITTLQYDRLCNVIRVHRLSEEIFKSILLKEFNAESWKLLNYDQMNSLIQHITKL